MTIACIQLQLFVEPSGEADVERRVAEILARRKACNASGQDGEDAAFIRVAIRAALAEQGGEA